MAKAFEFRFERMLRARRLKEDLAARELAVAQRATREQEERLAQLRAEDDAAKETLRGLRRRPIDFREMRSYDEYLAALERRLGEAVAARDELVRVEGEKRRALAEARQGVRVLEKFRERRLRAYLEARDREERKTLDEVARHRAGMER